MGAPGVISAAIIGLGNVAWKYDEASPDSPFALSQGGAMLRNGGVRLLGGCSPDAGDREAFQGWSRGLRAFAEPGAMLEELRPEMVGICSPNGEHFRHAVLCLEAGVRALWLEKPPTLAVRDLDFLITLARERGSTVCVNYPRRYNPVYHRLKDIFRQEEMGRCRLVNLLYSPGLARNGIHFLDQLFFLSGADDYELLWVEAARGGQSPGFCLRLSTGHLVQAAGADLPYHTNDISVVCERGMVSVLRGGAAVRVEECGPNPRFPGFFNLRSADGERFFGSVQSGGGMEKALADLLAAIGEGRQPASNLVTSRPAQRLLEEILERAGE